MNAIQAIYPYKHGDLWVFDDDRTGLVREPFIAGADVLIDRALEAKGITDGDKGFRLIFSAGEFPGYDDKLAWVREGEGGNTYRSETFGLEGWLCPALLQYFEAAPAQLYAQFEPKTA